MLYALSIILSLFFIVWYFDLQPDYECNIDSINKGLFGTSGTFYYEIYTNNCVQSRIIVDEVDIKIIDSNESKILYNKTSTPKYTLFISERMKRMM